MRIRNIKPVKECGSCRMALSQPTVFERLQLMVSVAQQIKMLQFSKTILKRLLRFTAMVTSFENMMVKPLDSRLRCLGDVYPG